MIKTAQKLRNITLSLILGISASAQAQTPGSDPGHPLEGTPLIQTSGLEVSIAPSLEADSVKWQIRDALHDEDIVLNKNAAHAGDPVLLVQNSYVKVHVRSQGLWYTDTLSFNGIQQDAERKTLAVPYLQNARFAWYLEGKLVSKGGPTFTPTVPGVYKSVIYWPAPTQGEYRAEFLSNIKSVYTGGGTTLQSALADTLLIGTSGLQVSVAAYLKADSVRWEVINAQTSEVSLYNYGAALATTPVTITQNSTVKVWALLRGLWHQQLTQFTGITQNDLNGTLTAPVIAGARYHWYFENEFLGNLGPEYTPTQTGTYKVIIFWDAAANARAAGESRAEFVFEVTRLANVTAITDKDLNTSEVSVFPIPASDYITVSHMTGGFEYTIESTSAGTITKGSASGMEPIITSHLKAGMYVLKVNNGIKELTRKFIIH